ncbi:ETS-related transcription factor Elf-1 [Fukomys damarensis]|uniref:ETS-related transcription factor Elf-1 n=1 Tax=Fukomys damarensis TaxID=885580 RepID=A0A091E3V2_FUKDA|nr:ETS-related transcription factor Elf-1 [Fukomys damarensis]
MKVMALLLIPMNRLAEDKATGNSTLTLLGDEAEFKKGILDERLLDTTFLDSNYSWEGQPTCPAVLWRSPLGARHGEEIIDDDDDDITLTVEAFCHNGDETIETIEAAEVLLNVDSPGPVLDEKRISSNIFSSSEDDIVVAPVTHVSVTLDGIPEVLETHLVQEAYADSPGASSPEQPKRKKVNIFRDQLNDRYTKHLGCKVLDKRQNSSILCSLTCASKYLCKAILISGRKSKPPRPDSKYIFEEEKQRWEGTALCGAATQAPQLSVTITLLAWNTPCGSPTVSVSRSFGEGKRLS